MSTLTREEQIQRARDLRTKGTEVLKLLGYTKIKDSFKEDDSCFKDVVYLTGTNEPGYIINVTACGYSAKDGAFNFHTMLMYDKYKRSVSTWKLNLDSINISYSKPVDQIVNEVKRRFIPQHETACIEMVNRIKDNEQSQDDKVSTVEALTGKPVQEKDKANDRFRVYNSELGIKDYFNLEVRSKDDIRIEHDFTLEQALKILEVLRKYPKKESEG